MALLSTTPVPTSEGWKPASELSSKDIVFNQRGEPQPVLSTQGWVPEWCYVVHMSDGLTVTGDRRLKFPCQDKNWREHFCRWVNRKSERRPKKFKSALHEIEVQDLVRGDLKDARGRLEFSVGVTSPVRFPPVDLPVPPYVFGFWIGTRTATGRHWLRDKINIKRVRARMRGHGYAVGQSKHKNGDTLLDIRPSVGVGFAMIGQTVPDNIPFSYLMSSPEQRFELLDGLIDAGDVTILKGGTHAWVKDASWLSVRRKQALLESLGFKTALHLPSKNLTFTLKFDSDRTKLASGRRFLTKIEKVEPKMCVNVVCDEPFLAGEGFIAVC